MFPLVTTLSARSEVATVASAIFAVVTAPFLIFLVVIAPFLSFAVATALFLICLVPTLFLASWLAARAEAPPSSKKRQSVETTFAYVRRGRNRFMRTSFDWIERERIFTFSRWGHPSEAGGESR